MAHTPGPWQWFNTDGTNPFENADEDSFSPDALIGSGEGGTEVLLVQVDAERNGTELTVYPILGLDLADAKLIAAAPDLLAACEAALEEMHSLIGEAGTVGNYSPSQGEAFEIVRAAIAKATA